MLLLDLFVSQNKLTELEAKDIEAEITSKDDVLVETLLAKKNIKGEEVTDIRGILYGLPIYTEDVPEDKELMKFLSVTQSKQLLAIPISFKDEVLSVGIVDPEHANVLDSLQFLFNSNHVAYKAYLISYGVYRRHFGLPEDASPIDEKASLTKKVDDASSITYTSQESDPKVIEATGDNLDLTDVTSSGMDADLAKLSTPEIISTILRYAIDNNASDIHIEHVGTAVRTRVRIDGRLETIATLPAKLHPMIVARIKVLSGIKLDEKRKPQDGRFSTKFGDHTIDYRVSTFPGYYGEKVVIRILDSFKGVKPIDTLGFQDQQMKELREAISRPYGMVLICGPTGSGKTTTLYAMLNEVDREHKNVVSLEDPVEYNMPSMNQSQVFPEIGYTFASGLRSILRQDPDIIMVGEIRDAETAQLAIQASLTGHLVFSTIHTNTAIGVINRLLDMGIEPYLIAPTLIATIGQRLARGIAEGCSTPVNMTSGMTEMINEQFKDLPDAFKSVLPLDQPFHDAKPNELNKSGLKGRVPVFEVLTFTDGIQDAILKKLGEEDIWKIARENGMITMKEDAMIKCMKGLVPFSEINDL
ncbi:MAG: type II/IV secretion system protein [Candidatus Taylorbacteria bacterium]|nr:type II/IV secretion system protein [Candidatus Taylorbacteria bacterium]